MTESGYYSDDQITGEMYCDIGKVATLEISTIDSIPNLTEQGYLAIKGYLFPPHNSIQCIPANLLPILQEIEKTHLTFIVDPNLPDPRMLHAVSPFRLRNLKDRLRTDIQENHPFSAAFSDLIEEEDENDEPQTLSSRRSVAIDVKRNTKYLDLPMNNPVKRNTTELILDTEELAKNDPEFFEIVKKNMRKKQPNTIFDDLNKRIKESEMNLKNLSIAEMETYKQAGLTQYLTPTALSPNLMGFPSSPVSDTSSVNSSVPSSPKPSLLERRKLANNLSLVVKPTTAPKENVYCYHMANYSNS